MISGVRKYPNLHRALKGARGPTPPTHTRPPTGPECFHPSDLQALSSCFHPGDIRFLGRRARGGPPPARNVISRFPSSRPTFSRLQGPQPGRSVISGFAPYRRTFPRLTGARGAPAGPERYQQVTILATYISPDKGRRRPRRAGVLSAGLHPSDLCLIG